MEGGISSRPKERHVGDKEKPNGSWAEKIQLYRTELIALSDHGVGGDETPNWAVSNKLGS